MYGKICEIESSSFDERPKKFRAKTKYHRRFGEVLYIQYVEEITSQLIMRRRTR